MYYITKKDEEVVKSLTFFMKVSKNINKLYDQFEKKYEENPNDIDTAFSFAVYNLLRLDNIDYIVDISYLNTDSIFEAFNRIIKLKEDHWLAWMLKCMFISAFPPTMMERKKIEENVNYLIELQEKSDSAPYFFISYVILADFHYSNNEKEKAIVSIETGIKKVTPGKVLYLADYLSHPLKKLIPKLVRGKENETLKKIKEYCRILFPDDQYFKDN